MRILFLSSEVVPFAKTGGLADVAGALPKELTRLGHEVIVMMPRYKQIDKDQYNLKLAYSDVAEDVGDKTVVGAAFKSVLPGSKTAIYFIENNDLYDRDSLYGTPVDYPDNAERFIFFSRSVLSLIKRMDWKPDIIHCNDWQTGLVPALLSSHQKTDPFYRGIRTVFTIHNLAYQGVFAKETMELTGLSWDYFSMDKLEFWGKVNFLKAALVYADLITTVSPRYSKEIQTEEYGAGLHGVLTDRRERMRGILNGIDYQVFNPAKDPNLCKNYTLKTMGDKLANKRCLLKEVGLRHKKTAPLYGIVSRLVEQKGFDILAEILDEFLTQNVQLIILGTGDPTYHKLLEEIQTKYPTKFRILLKYDAIAAQHIYAGCDFFLMPSRFEPCGLGQLISLRYGTIPVVRETGGLADTIVDFDLAKDFEHDRGNGYVFVDYNSEELFKVLKRSAQIFQDEMAWKKIRHNAMRCDFSWKSSAKTYIEAYQSLI